MTDTDIAPSVHTLIRHDLDSAKAAGIKPNDEVWYRTGYSNAVHKGFVASLGFPENPTDDVNGLKKVVVSSMRDQVHGTYVDYLLLITPHKPQSKKKDKLVLDALAAAKDLGYCDETKNVIRKMGLTIPTTTVKRKVKLEITVEGPVDEDATLDDLGVSIRSNRNDVTVKVV